MSAMELAQARRILEGILFISPEPVTPKRLKLVLAGMEPAVIQQLIDELNAEYAQRQHAFFIQEVAGGWRLVTDPQLAAWIKRAMELPREEGLSKRALETLAIVAYKQPMTRAEIETIRGVDVSGTLDTLLERALIEVVGRKDSAGRPMLYGTTTEFLRHFGLKSLKDLPPLGSGSTPTLPGSDRAAIEAATEVPRVAGVAADRACPIRAGEEVPLAAEPMAEGLTTEPAAQARSGAAAADASIQPQEPPADAAPVAQAD
jgi:segregation and condensation protein B